MRQELRNKMIKSGVSMAIIAALLIFASVAWFASNRNVSSSGMNIQVAASPNLVIAKTSADISKPSWNAMEVDFGEEAKKYAPCTHDGSSTTGLKYVKNTNDVDYFTGNMKADKSETFANAINVAGKATYYIEKIVYIASNGAEMPSATLQATITSAVIKRGEEEADITSGSLMATSVDFYTKNGEVLIYKGTANVKSKASSVVILPAGSTVPLNTSGYIEVVMRFYFDGALQNDESPANAYISSATVDASIANIGLTFTAITTDN